MTNQHNRLPLTLRRARVRLRRRLWPLRLADSHVHLDSFPAAAIPGIVARARAAGVISILTIGSGQIASRNGVALARRFPGVLAAVGVHPRHAGGIDLDSLGRLIDEGGERVRAIGEIGLDFAGGGAPRKVQMVALEAQLALARDRRLPVVLHGTGAHDLLAATLGRHRAGLSGVAVHYFNGSERQLRAYLDLDCYVSFGRLMLKEEGAALRPLVGLVPAGRLLVETDSYPLPGRTTEPRDVRAVVLLAARLRGERPRQTAEQTYRNFHALVGHPDASAATGSAAAAVAARLWRETIARPFSGRSNR